MWRVSWVVTENVNKLTNHTNQLSKELCRTWSSTASTQWFGRSETSVALDNVVVGIGRDDKRFKSTSDEWNKPSCAVRAEPTVSGGDGGGGTKSQTINGIANVIMESVCVIITATFHRTNEHHCASDRSAIILSHRRPRWHGPLFGTGVSNVRPVKLF